MSLHKHLLIAASTALVSTFAVAGGLVLEEVATAPAPHYGVTLSSANAVGLFYETEKYEFALETRYDKTEIDYISVSYTDTSIETIDLGVYAGMKSPLAADTTLSLGLFYGKEQKSGSTHTEDPLTYALYTSVSYAANEKISLFTRAAIYDYTKASLTNSLPINGNTTKVTGFFNAVETGVKINL